MIVVAIIALLAAIAIPNALRGQTSANESSAIGNMRALVSSLGMYQSVNNVYPDDTPNIWRVAMYGNDCLAGTPPDPDFGSPSFCRQMGGGPQSVVQGYRYRYTGVALGATYDVLATPDILDTTGTRSFFADQSGLILHGVGGAVRADFTDGDESTVVALPTDCD